MMRKLDQRGVAALEFCIAAVPLFLLMFAICDLGRYAITKQSLHKLANAGGRAWMICYQNDVLQSQSTSNCTGDQPIDRATVPFLYAGGLTPTLTATQAGSLTTVTARLPGFTMLFPTIWGPTFNAPSASTKIPF
jgi:Flp pilus assembly protein TadG